MKTARALVVLRALGLGDFLTGLPAMRALEKAFPGHRRILAAPEPLRPLVELAGWELAPFRLGTEPLAGPVRPDAAVNLHGKGPDSHRALLPLSAARLIAFRSDEIPATSHLPLHRDDEHEVERWCRLLRESGISADPSRLDLSVPEDHRAPGADLVELVSRHPGAVVIHPGAASGARRWPPGRWAEVAESLRKQGRPVFLTGGKHERGLAGDIAAEAGLKPGANLAAQTDLVSLARVVSRSSLALSADTGFSHLATAVGTPSVTLFGPVSPALWGPPANRLQHIAIWKGLSGDPHANRPSAGLLQITPAEVLERIDQLAAVSPYAESGRF